MTSIIYNIFLKTVPSPLNIFSVSLIFQEQFLENISN